MSAPAFGILCAGRPVQTDYQTIDDARIVFTIADVVHVKHVAVFLTGAIQLPDGFGAAVYFLWINEDGVTSSKYLGFIANDKPSSLFRLSRFHHASPSAGQTAFMAGLPTVSSCSAQLGISLEPLSTIAGYMADPAQSGEHHVEFAQYCAENLYNYVSSFGKALSSISPGFPSNEVVVPITAIVQWYQKFSERLKIDPNFWKN